MIPKTFSTVTVHWDKQIYIQKEMDQETFEATRLQVEKHIREGQEKVDLRWGYTGLLSPEQKH